MLDNITKKHILICYLNRNQPSFFPLVSVNLIVVGVDEGVGVGGAARLRTTSDTVFPLSRKTCTAVAYSTFSNDTPLTLMIRSFTLKVKRFI